MIMLMPEKSLFGFFITTNYVHQQFSKRVQELFPFKH